MVENKKPNAPRPAASARPGGPIQRAKPAARPRAAVEEDEEGEEVEERPRHRKEEGLDQSTKIGLIATGGLAVIVAIVLFVVMRKHADEKKALEEYEAKVADIQQRLQKLDVTQESDAAAAIELAEKTRETWLDHEKGRDIEMLLVKAKGKVEAGKDQRATIGRFVDIEKKLADASSQTPEAIKDLRRQLDELEVKMQVLGADMIARYATARNSADVTYANRILEDAQKFATDNPGDGRMALVRFQNAEEELRALVDRAYTDKNEEQKKLYTPLYQRAIEESDRLVTELFSGEAADKLPVVDCLSGTKATEWNASQAKGFSWRCEKGVLQIVGPDPDAGRNAVISIGDREQWRSFIADIEFTLESGAVDMYFRLGKAPNSNTPMLTWRSTGNNSNVRPGVTYKARATMIGSTFTVTYADDVADPPPTHSDNFPWSVNRKGAIGMLVPAGTKIKFTKFTVRELR